MVNCCVCAGCNNSNLSGHRVHRFPNKKSKDFRAWIRFVQAKRSNFASAAVTKHTVICEQHFTAENYNQGDFMEYQMGFRRKEWVRLISGAVPSVHTSLPTSSGGSEATSRDSARRKRELSTVLGESAASSDGAGATASSQPEDDGDGDIFTMDPEPSVLHRGSQCNIRCSHRSSAVQVKPQMVSVGTQTERLEKRRSTPLVSPDQSDDELSFSDVITHSGDMSWNPEEDMLSESSEEEPSEEPLLEPLNDPNDVDKFVVCQEQLLSLFTVCPACCGESQGHIIYQEGTYIKVKQACGTCGYERDWQNQHLLHRNMPACNLLLSGAIHFSGCMATQTIRMLKLFGLQCISPATFFRHQRLYTIPTIIAAWKNEQMVIIREVKEMECGLILSGDCRSDSPGHCAKYGSYSLIEDRINKVLDVQLVQSSEVPSSSWCELEGLKRSMEFLKEQNMQVSALITDRNRQVAKWVREQLQETSHFFDIWHIGKSLQKTLDAAAKERECEDLKLWRPAIINHLYWTAASTPTGDPDEMEAKWQSMMNHVQDIHEHNTPAFPRCAHPPLEGEARNKEWLEPGSTVAVKLESIAAKKALVKDVRKLSPQHQTFSLEAFHSLILHFAPKHTGFSFLGMYSRLLLAALHFNCNSSRQLARTSEGEARYAVRYPRFRKGGWVVRPIMEKPSYGYASKLMASLAEGYSNSPQALQDRSALLSSAAPPPLTTSLQKIPKDEAVSLHLARHSRFNSSVTS